MRLSQWDTRLAIGALVALLACSKVDSGSAGASSSRPSSTSSPAPGTASPSAAPAAPPATGAGSGATGAPPSACSVANAADIAAALGQSFAPKAEQRPAAFPTVSVCDYQPAGGKTLIIRTETIDKAGWEKSVSLAKGAVAVAGVGDSAYFQANKIMGISEGQFLAYKGKTSVSINYGGMGLDMGKVQSGEQALMVKILTRI
jgi:hypothetical protein